MQFFELWCTEIYGERFYVFNLEIARLSGNADIIPITVSERIVRVIPCPQIQYQTWSVTSEET